MADRKHGGGLEGGGKDPHRNASSRVLRRLASRSPRGPGVALRRGPLKRGDAF